MNIVILTPGRAGSALLRDVITAHVANSNFDKPVINLYELAEGHMVKEYSSTFEQSILSNKGIDDYIA